MEGTKDCTPPRTTTIPLALTKRLLTDKQKANLQREHITEQQKHAQAIQQQAWKVW